jgi:hypothetical protein
MMMLMLIDDIIVVDDDDNDNVDDDVDGNKIDVFINLIGNLLYYTILNQGYFGECGLRGGYFEIFGIPADVKAELYKVIITYLSSLSSLWS